MKINQRRKASITILFASPADALEWFGEAVASGVLQDEAALFQIDSLDTTGTSGVPSPNEFIVRRAGSRPNPVTVTTTKTITGR